jgi:hypothetical protein
MPLDFRATPIKNSQAKIVTFAPPIAQTHQF